MDISDGTKVIILNRINDFNTKDEQDTYLQAFFDSTYVKDTSKRQIVENSKPKIYSYKYFIEIDGSRKQVCKKAFLSLHGVTDNRIKSLQLLKVSGKSPHDMRGKSAGSRSNVVAPETCVLIHQFVESIPVKETHYSKQLKDIYLLR